MSARRVVPRRLLLAAVLCGVAGGGLAAWLYHTHVVRDPGPVTPDGVRAVVAQESPVFYRDGVTRIGVFFEDEHRDYVPFEDLPIAWTAGIVAAEDDGFWRHLGLDPVHIARAMKDNLVASVSAGSPRLVAGGSTLTQQTAKNLFYRPDRSLRAKLDEAVQSLRLEAHFDKHEILEFYANQFHVTGNGRGLGIAARYFFDRRTDQLTVVESAFLAGLVKGPASYDPFRGDEARRARNRARAHDRTRYVLRRMVAEPAERIAGPAGSDAASVAARARRTAEVEEIQAEAARLLDEGFELPFARGTFRYDSSAVLDEVARRLGEAPFPEVLARAGIEDPETAGLQVVTTLDPDAQRAATYGLWHHLTEVGAMLEADGAADYLRDDVSGPRHDPEHRPRVGEFRLAEAVDLVEDEGRYHLEVDLGGRGCTVDRDAVIRAAVAVRRGVTRDRNARIPTADVNAFAEALLGGVVWVSVRSVGEDGAICDLERRPELQGAVVVLEDAQVRAMVGGNDNRNFNRATALRQLGSTWKPIVFHAAMELGWASGDALDNRAGVFPFSTTFYWPRPDHRGEPVVSMAWAAARSENLASVWLLHHLTDRLDTTEAIELAGSLGLLAEEGESSEGYRLRVQRAGVLPTPSRRREGWFLRARHEVARRLDQRGEDAVDVRSLAYGWGFEAERRRATAPNADRALDHAWQVLEERRRRCGEDHAALTQMWDLGVAMPTHLWLGLRAVPSEAGLQLVCGRHTDRGEPLATWLTDLPDPTLRPPLAPEASMWVDDRLQAGVIDEIQDAMTRLELADSLAAEPDLYAPEALVWHRDFRVLLGLRYVARLARRYGVRTEVQEVLSLPLGASEATLEDLTTVYGGLATGRAWRFPGRSGGLLGRREVGPPPAATLLIAELRDVDGRVLYRATPEAEEVAVPEVAAMSVDQLRQVVVHGTGVRARDAVRLRGGPLPVAGKTGTTNDFRNAAFLGVLPRVDPVAQTGWVQLGVYVGYDDNRPMERGRMRFSGSSGALPAWIATAQGLARTGVLGPPDAVAPPEGWTMPVPAGLVAQRVDTRGGLPVGPDDGSDVPTATILTRAPQAPPALQVRAPDAGDLPVRIAPSLKDPRPRRGKLWGALEDALDGRVPPGGAE